MTAKPFSTERAFAPRWITTPLNVLIAGLLRSPLHGALSASTLILSFRGRRSGKQYTFPVGYYAHEGDTLYVIPLHRWWVNLQGNVPVMVWLKGRKYNGAADASQGDETTVQALEKLIHDSANLLRVYHVERDAEGEPNAIQIHELAESLALMRIQIDLPA